MCSPAIFETCSSYDKDTWIAATDYYMYIYIIVLFLSYSPVNNFFQLHNFSILVNDVILLLNCLVLILYLHVQFLLFEINYLLKHYLELYITDTVLKVSRSLYCFITSISHCVENYFPRLWCKGILMRFLCVCPQTNTVLEVNYEFGEVRRLDLSSLVEAATDSFTRNFRTQQVYIKYIKVFLIV